MEGVGYFSKDMLSKETLKELESIAIDSGTSFLSGKVTSTVFKATTSDIGATATNIVAAGLGTYETGKVLYNDIKDNGVEIIITLSQVLVSKATEVITKEVAKITSDYLLKHTQEITSFPKNVTSYAMEYFNEHKMSVSDVLKTLKDASENRMKELNDKEDNKSLEDSKAKKQKDMKQVLNNINTYVNEATSYISTITSYIQNGPDWVVDEMNKQIGSIVKQVQKSIDKQWIEKDLPEYRARAKRIGEKKGQNLTDKYNRQLEKVQKKALDKIEQAKTKGITKVLSVKAKAASLIASKTGIYIPI